MLFNSIEFPIFLLVVLAVHFCLIPRRAWRGRKRFLVIASFLFYMAWSPFFGLLLLFSTILDFTLGRAIAGAAWPNKKKLLVTVSVVANLGVLGFFKYGQFVADNAAALLDMTLVTILGPIRAPRLDVALPPGIS